jgi:hypothetical protein
MQGRTGIGSDLSRWPRTSIIRVHPFLSACICVSTSWCLSKCGTGAAVPSLPRARAPRRYSPPMIERSFLVRPPAALGAQICAPIAGSPSHGRSKLRDSPCAGARGGRSHSKTATGLWFQCRNIGRRSDCRRRRSCRPTGSQAGPSWRRRRVPAAPTGW